MWACDVCTPLRGFLLPQKDGSRSTDPDCEVVALGCGLFLWRSVNVMRTRRAPPLSPPLLLASVSVDTRSNQWGWGCAALTYTLKCQADMLYVCMCRCVVWTTEHLTVDTIVGFSFLHEPAPFSVHKITDIVILEASQTNIVQLWWWWWWTECHIVCMLYAE